MACAKLYSRKNGKGHRIYYVRYYLPGQREKRRQFTIGNVSSRRAKEIAERIRALIIQGVDPHEFAEEQAEKTVEKNHLRLSELEEAYIQHCLITNRSSTIEIKRNAFRDLRFFLGDCYAAEITPEKIEAWMTSLNISKTTVNIKLRTIRAMFNWGFKREMIDVNPFKNGGIKQYKVPDNDPEGFFNLDEVRLILKTLKNQDEMLWRLVFLALETGGRLSELIALTGDDIEPRNERILFRGPTTKTGQRRYVPLRPAVIEEIKKWGIKKDEKLFSWKYASNASKRFRRLLREFNLWKIRNGTRCFHTLRHTYASHLLMSGVNIFTVSRWLGHSSVRVTEKHYGHLIPNTVEVKLPW